MSGQQVGGGAAEGCASSDNHEHPPFRAVLSAMHGLSAAYVGERMPPVKLVERSSTLAEPAR